MLNQKGQAFDAYRILLGAILGLLILVIIVSSINYFEGLRLQVSQQRFYDGLSNAVSQPNGEIFLIEDLIFKGGDSFSTRLLERRIGLEEGCLSFSSDCSDGFECDSDIVDVKNYILASVKTVCETNRNSSVIYCGSSCEICCEVTFDAEG